MLSSKLNQQSLFKEVSDQAGIHNFGQSWGSSWSDFNGDGLPDLWVSNHRNPDALYINQGNGTFLNEFLKFVTPPQTLVFDNHGTAWADFDNDGDQDIIALSGGGGDGTIGVPNRFYVNDGGKLTDQAKELNLTYREASSRSPLWFDYDLDGKLDLLNGVRFRPNDPTSLPVTIFRQDIDGFHDVRAKTDLDQVSDATYGILTDLSGDHRLDLVLKSKPRAVFDLNSKGLENIADNVLVKNTALNGEDYAAADFNGDQRIDLFVKKTNGQDRLLINSPKQGLSDQTEQSGIEVNPGSSVVHGDFDNDRDVDLYIVTKGNSPNVLYLNNGDGTFKKSINALGAAGASLGTPEVVSSADFDQNGFLDLFVTNGRQPSNTAPAELFKNQGNGNHWLQIDFQGIESNRDGIGNTVWLTSADGLTQIREQSNGIHNRTQNHQRVHFGLGESPTIQKLEVLWSLGVRQTFTNFEGDKVLLVQEGIGNSGEDTIVGTANDNILQGLSGNDTLIGLGGRDVLAGGPGNDILIGGEDRDKLRGGQGQDKFQLSLTDDGVDVIEDFSPNETDSLVIQVPRDSGIPKGILGNNRFVIGSSAQDSSDRIAYNSESGTLFYDSDGDGVQPLQRIARLINTPLLNAQNIRITF